jgi:uncharacterized repeat protein (TIGR03803 family)
MSLRVRKVTTQTLVLSLATLLFVGVLSAQVSETAIWTFSGPDGLNPDSPLLIDPLGRLFGTTGGGGSGNCACGVAYELFFQSGSWHYKLLHAFQGGDDGGGPGGRLVRDDAGNIYGVTGSGGAHRGGTVYRLSPIGGGGYAESVIYSFEGVFLGTRPNGLAIDAAGNIYGTTQAGGSSNNGFVYELSPSSGGSFTFNQLYSFGPAPDGASPAAEVILDSSGNLYGTAQKGGTFGDGTVFELSLDGGTWIETTLHNFGGGAEFGHPSAPVTFGPSGNLYGTEGGYAYELAPNPDGTWTETLIHQFGIGVDGLGADSGLVYKGSALYGTTSGGGRPQTGTVYGLEQVGTGWKEPHLYDFRGFGTGDGITPVGGVTFGKGVLYGVTCCGGASGSGIVYQLTP